MVGAAMVAVVVAGGAGSEESVLEPTWHPDGSLYFVSDRDQGWWGIFKVFTVGAGRAEGNL